jgi:shikimate dehydrogenase
VVTRCAVVGTPIRHSLSPAMHAAAYDELGLADWSYGAVELSPEELEGFLDGLDEQWRGLSLTMPLKRTVVPLLDSLDDHARRSNAANTVLLGEKRRIGFNTDVPGAAAAMAERLRDPVRSAVVLGGGATATSVLLALADRGCTTARLLVRDPARVEETVATVSAHPAAPVVEVGLLSETDAVAADLVVSTIPVSAQTPQLLAACASVPAVFEVVYDPWPTPLARAASDSGRVLVSGLDLLAHQAVLQLQVMTGRSVEVELLREAGRAELARRAVENAPTRAPAP